MAARHRSGSVQSPQFRRVRVPIWGNWATEFIRLRQEGFQVKLNHRAQLWAMAEIPKRMRFSVRVLAALAGFVALFWATLVGSQAMPPATPFQESSPIPKTQVAVKCSQVEELLTPKFLASLSWKGLGGISYAEGSLKCSGAKHRFRIIKSLTSEQIVSVVPVK